MGKFDVPSHIVVPDTNCLFTREPSNIVSPGFEAKWSECLSLAKLQLFIPEVVKQELIFQQVLIAKKSRENAYKSLKTIADITATKPLQLKNDDQIKRKVNVTFEKWQSKIGATVKPTPIKKRKWKEIIEAALWRQPPFAYPSEPGDDSEKGFRDALILETLYEIWHSHPEAHVVFISNDDLTKQTAILKAGKNAKRLVFASLNDFYSYLKLFKEEYSKKFVDAVIKHASSMFYTQNDPNCVYMKFNVPERIQKEHALILNPILDPQPQAQPSIGLSTFVGLPNIPSLKMWKPISEEKIFLGTTRFDAADQSGRFIWKSQVDFVRLCAYEDSQARGLRQMLPPIRQIRIAKFDVIWNSVVPEDVEFSDPQLLETKFLSKEFEIPTFEKCLRYNLAREMGFGSESQQ